MDADDLRWLLQTLETPEMAERFVLAQHRQGRISDHVIAEVELERPWVSQVVIQAKRAATHQSSEYAPTETFVGSRREHHMEAQSSAHSERTEPASRLKFPQARRKNMCFLLVTSKMEMRLHFESLCKQSADMIFNIARRMKPLVVGQSSNVQRITPGTLRAQALMAQLRN